MFQNIFKIQAMMTEIQTRSQIVRRIQKIPIDKLKELDDFIIQLEQKSSSKKNVLSFAGSWASIDDSVMIDFTDNLVTNRQRNRQRIDE